MEPLAIWVNHKREQPEKEQKRRQRCIKQMFVLQDIAGFGVDQHEQDGRRCHAEQLQIRKRFRTAIGHHERILQITQAGVIKQNEKEDKSHRDRFLHFIRMNGKQHSPQLRELGFVGSAVHSALCFKNRSIVGRRTLNGKENFKNLRRCVSPPANTKERTYSSKMAYKVQGRCICINPVSFGSRIMLFGESHHGIEYFRQQDCNWRYGQKCKKLKNTVNIAVIRSGNGS